MDARDTCERDRYIHVDMRECRGNEKKGLIKCLLARWVIDLISLIECENPRERG